MLKTICLFLLEIAPVILFFGIGQRVSFSQATAVYVASTLLSMLAVWLIAQRLSYLGIIFGVVIVSAGSLSVIYSNPDILLVADTLYYLGSAAVLLGLHYYGYNLLTTLFGATFGMSDRGWTILLYRWAGALIIVGILNELIRQYSTLPVWLTFQLLKTISLILFATYQFTLSKKYRLENETNAWGVRI